MSSPLPPLSLSATALGVLQARAVPVAAASSARDAQRAVLIRPSSDAIAAEPPQDAAAPLRRGQIINILV